MNLDGLVAAARTSPAWTDERAARVLGRTLRAREAEALRGRTHRRLVFVGAAAATLALLLLRPAAAGPTDPPGAVAQLDTGDGGYGHD